MRFRIVRLAVLALLPLLACHKEPAPVIPNVESAEVRAERGVRLWWSISPERHTMSREEFARRVTLVGKPTLLNSREQCFDSYVLVDWAYVKRSDCFETSAGRVRGFTFGGPMPKETKLAVQSRWDLKRRLRAAGQELAADSVGAIVRRTGGRLVMTNGNVFDMEEVTIALDTGTIRTGQLCGRGIVPCDRDQ